MRKRLYSLLDIFSRVMTGVTLAVALFTTVVNPTEMVETALFWQIPAVSGLCTLTALIYPWNREMGKKEAVLKTLIHYVLINAIVLGSGALFYWYDASRLRSVISMVALIAAIFWTITISSWKKAALEAARMNEKLAEYQRQHLQG